MKGVAASIVGTCLVAAAGCLPSEPNSLVPASPFGPSADQPVQTRVAYAPANLQTAARVDCLGRKIIAANKIGVKPLFRTIGSPQAEVFHCGTAEVDVTEGLVALCPTDAQLAAVLCQELGKMVSEREALAGPQARLPEREPPAEVPIGNDGRGTFGPADQTHLAELAKYDKDRRRPAAGALPPPDPQFLARAYLKQAGFAEADLDAAAPILQAAAANSVFEKQFNATAPARPWIH